MSAVAHEPRLGDVAHLRGQDEIQHARDEDEPVRFAEAELPGPGMSCCSRHEVKSVSGTTIPRLSAIQSRSQSAKIGSSRLSRSSNR